MILWPWLIALKYTKEYKEEQTRDIWEQYKK